MLNYQIISIDALENTLKENGYRLISFERFGPQLRSMQAWTIDGEVEDLNTGEVLPIEILQSYYTLVAYKLNGKAVRCGRWSTSTSKQSTIWGA